LITRLLPSSLFLAATVVGGGLLLSACSSDRSPDSPSADSSATATQTVSESRSPDPSTPTEVETNDERSVAQKLADASIEAKVKRALIRESSLRVFPFRPTVVNGHLVLRGDVNTPDQYRRAERIAGQVDGVTAVTNRLTMGGRAVTEARLEEGAEQSPEETSAVYHTVRQGDNLWDIARKYGASIQQIKNFNDLRSNNLRPGQRIRVR
jgi:LysM repeat protein